MPTNPVSGPANSVSKPDPEAISPSAPVLSLDQLLSNKSMKDLFVAGLLNSSISINGMSIDMVRRALDDND